MELTETLERQVLGACLQNPQAVAEVEGILAPDDFAEPRNELLYRAVLALQHEGKPTSPLAVADYMEAQKAPGHGWEVALLQMQQEVAIWYNVGYYAERLRELATRRRLQQVARVMNDQAARMDLDPERVRVDTLAAIEAITIPGRRNLSASVADMSDAELDALGLPAKYVATPWRSLNDYVDGWRAGALYTIGARTGVGKTAFALNAAKGLAGNGWVLFVSCEMSASELWQRLLCNLADVPLNNIHRHALSDRHWSALAAAMPIVKGQRIEIMDGGFAGMLDLRRRAMQIRRERGSLAGIVLDYLGLMLPRDSADKRWERMADLTQDVKALARELDVPILALSQLGRGAAGDKAPTLADLRESGSVEQDSDVVLLMARGDHDSGIDSRTVEVAKNRHGAQGTFELLFEGSLQRLTDL